MQDFLLSLMVVVLTLYFIYSVGQHVNYVSIAYNHDGTCYDIFGKGDHNNSKMECFQRTACKCGRSKCDNN